LREIHKKRKSKLLDAMLKRIKKTTLTNGVKIYYLKNKELPIVSFAIGIETGSYFDPEGKEGLFYLTSLLIDKGSDNLSAFEIREFFDNLGAKFNIVASKNLLVIKILCEERFFDRIFDFLFDILSSPSFREEEIIKEKERVISEILQEEEDPESLISKKFYEVLYRNSPVSHPLEGYIESLKSIERHDIVSFYRDKILKRKMYVAGTGSIDFEKFYKKIENSLGKLKGLKDEFPEFKFRDKPEKIILVLRKKINQVFLRLGHFSLYRKDKDYPKLVLSNYILGGGAFASRLFNKIRNEKGYVYSVYSRFFPLDPFKGPLIYSFQTGKDNFKPALELLIEEIKKFKLKGPLKEEIEEAKGFFKGSIPRETETYPQITNMLLSALKYNLSPLFMFSTLDEIIKLKKRELLEFVQKFYDYENLCGTVIVPEDYDILFLKKIFPEHKMVERL